MNQSDADSSSVTESNTISGIQLPCPNTIICSM